MLLESETYLGQIKAAAGGLGKCADSLKKRAVVVTGAAGMLGSCVMDMLLYLNERHDYQMELYAAGRTGSRLHERFGGYCGKIGRAHV